jgi:hypothetical protein
MDIGWPRDWVVTTPDTMRRDGDRPEPNRSGSVALDIQLCLHTDGLHESGGLKETIAAIGGRTMHAYHVEGDGGGHVPDLITEQSKGDVARSEQAHRRRIMRQRRPSRPAALPPTRPDEIRCWSRPGPHGGTGPRGAQGDETPIDTWGSHRENARS